MKYLLLLSLIYLIISELDEDREKCINTDYTSKNCWSADTKVSDYECCLIEYDNIDNGTPEKSCSFIEKRIGKIYKEKGTVEISKETYGYQMAKQDPSFSPNIGMSYILYKYTCENYSFNMESNIRFSESEIEILKSEDYCLNYDIFMGNFPEEEVTEEICKNAKILPDSEKEGIKCALFELSFESENFKTCHLFNTNLNELDYLTSNMINSIIASGGGSSIKIKISGDGISSNYDSETGVLINENENKNKSKKRYRNKSTFTSVSKYSLLAFLILL